MSDTYQQAIKQLREVFLAPLEDEHDLTDVYVLTKDLATISGVSKTVDILKEGTPFIKKIGTGYHSDGIHLVLSRKCENVPEYFQRVKPS